MVSDAFLFQNHHIDALNRSPGCGFKANRSGAYDHQTDG